MWVPHYGDQTQPVYLMIANALEQDIESGRLAAGDRLPTLKDLAEALECDARHRRQGLRRGKVPRGLVVGEVGRGTFVKAAAAAIAYPVAARTHCRRKQPDRSLDHQT